MPANTSSRHPRKWSDLWDTRGNLSQSPAKRSEVPARHAKGHETYPLPDKKKSRNLFQVTQVSPLPPPRDIFEKESMWQFYTLCDIRFCQSINKRTKENVNHCNNQSQLKIHGYFWHNDIKRVCDSFCDIMSCQNKNKNKKKEINIKFSQPLW